MPQISYKNYLDYLQIKTEPLLLKKSLFILFVIFCLGLGSATAFTYNQQRKIQLNQEEEYRQTVSASFNSTRQSIEEVLASFKVAGEKIEVIDEQKEATSSAAGFYASVEDLTKMIAKIEAVQKNIEFQKGDLKAFAVEQEYLKLHADLNYYFDSAHSLLGNLATDYRDALQFSLASGEKFYLPILTNEALWQTQDKAQIIAYYESIKKDANSALEKYAAINAQESLKNYQRDQVAYIEQAVNVADGIILLLNSPDSENPEEATQIEKAYGLLTNTKGANEELFQRIISEKLEFTGLKRAVFQFSPIMATQNSVEVQMNDLFGGFTK